MDNQRRVIEHVQVELQAKPPLEIDTAPIKNLVRDFHRSDQERQRQNTAGGNANNVVGFLGLFLWVITFFHSPNIFTLEMEENMLQTEGLTSHNERNLWKNRGRKPHNTAHRVIL